VLWRSIEAKFYHSVNKVIKRSPKTSSSCQHSRPPSLMARIVMAISLITAARAFTGALAKRPTRLRKGTARFASHPVSMRMRTWPLLKG
jgi:hypothetical protein